MVASMTLIVTPAPEDVVSIKKAQYRSKARKLQVAADSPVPGAKLSACRDVSVVCNAFSDSFLGMFVDGRLNIKITSPPSSIRVDSDRGGYATAIVVIKYGNP